MLPGAQYAQTEMSGTIGAVILAAGEGRRFGGRKQLAEIDGRSMLEHVIERAAEAGLDPVVAVVPVWLTRPARMVDPRIGWVRNPYPERGMSHSLRLGFAALPATVGAAVILLGDQPTMPRAHIAAVIAARGDRPLVATRVDGHAAPPVLVEASHFDIVRAAEGDEGLRSLLAAHPEWVRQVAIADPGARRRHAGRPRGAPGPLESVTCSIPAVPRAPDDDRARDGRRRGRGRASARVHGAPAPARRVRRPGPREGEPRDPHRCRPAP